MKHTFTKPSPTKAELVVTLDAADLVPYKTQAVHKLAKRLKVAGFRPGKVPAHVAEKHLDSATLQQEVLEAAVNQSYIQTIMAEDAQPLDRPQIAVTKFVPFDQVEFKVEVEVLPEIKLPDYRKIKKQAPKVKVSAAEVTEVIDRLRGQVAEKTDVERTAKDGDEVVIDFAGKDQKDEPVSGATGTDYPLRLGSKTFIDGFEDNLSGLKKGDSKEFTLTFPKDYGHAPLRNKKVTFAITVKKVSEINLPAADDAFAKKVGPFKSLDELKDDIKQELSRQKETEARNKLKNDIMDELTAKAHFELPGILVRDQEQMVRQDATQNLMYRGLSLQGYLTAEGLTEEEWLKKEVTPAAEKRVAIGLILSEIAKKENITVSPQEVAARIAQMKPNLQDVSMKAQLDTPEAQRDVASRLATEKTIDFLLQQGSAA